MQTPSTASIWLSQQAGPALIILCIVAFIFLVLFLSSISRRRALARSRSGINEHTFVDYLAGFGFNTEITRITYRYLQEQQNVAFPIEPSDQLDEDLGLDSDDIRQSVRELLAATSREYQPGMLHQPLVTVEDLVRYLQSCPRKTDVAA